MKGKIRPELSERNPYWIERHRYYELKQFCLQYPIWKKQYAVFNELSRKPLGEIRLAAKDGYVSDPTGRCAEEKAYYSNRIKMIERVAIQTDPKLADYLITGVTEGISYDILKARYDVPCCKEVYYNAYRKFFWLLDRVRG